MSSKTLITLVLVAGSLAVTSRASDQTGLSPAPAPSRLPPTPGQTTPSAPTETGLDPAPRPHRVPPVTGGGPAPTQPTPAPVTTPPNSAGSPPPSGGSGSSAQGTAPGRTRTTGSIATATGTRSPLVTTDSGAFDSDPSSWETWWTYNQDRYLELKTHIAALEVSTGGDSIWLGSDSGARSADAGSELVVPALLAVLEKERQQDLVTSATIALASMADGPVAARAAEFSRAFAAFVDDPNRAIEERSVLARGIVGDESSAPELTALLADSASARKALGGQPVPTRTRAIAAYALGLMAAHSHNEDVRRFIVHHLARTLHEDMGATPDVHVGCVLALGLAPLAWTNKLGEGIDAPATVAAARRVSTVATASRETQIETLLAVLVDSRGDRFVRAQVPTALAKLSAGASPAACVEITNALLAALVPTSQEPDQVIQGCTLALGCVDGVDCDDLSKKVRTTLQRVVTSGERQARSFALIALAQRAARGKSDQTAAETRAWLAQRLTDGKSHERAWAALALGILERERVIKGEVNSMSVRSLMLARLKDCGSPDEMGALAIGCGLAGEVDAVPVLLAKLARTADARVQGHIAVALGLLGDARATPALRDVLSDSRFRPLLLHDAAVGLALLEDRSLVPTLVDTLSRATSLASQGAAAEVIGWIGDRRAIDPLLTLLQNRDATASARGFAAAALGRVCDRDRLPWNAVLTENVHYRAATATLIGGDGTGLLEIL